MYSLSLIKEMHLNEQAVFQARYPSRHPTNSVKAPKAYN